MKNKIFLVIPLFFLLLTPSGVSAAKSITSQPEQRHFVVSVATSSFYLEFTLETEGQIASPGDSKRFEKQPLPTQDECKWDATTNGQGTVQYLSWAAPNPRMDVMPYIDTDVGYWDQFGRWDDPSWTYGAGGDDPYFCFVIAFGFGFGDGDFLTSNWYSFEVHLNGGDQAGTASGSETVDNNIGDIPGGDGNGFFEALPFNWFFVIPLLLIPILRRRQ